MRCPAHTTTESDFSGSFITGYDSSSSRCGPAASIRRPNPRPPGSRAKSFHTCQGLRPRQVGRTLALTRPSMLPSVKTNTSAPGTFKFSRASRPVGSHHRPLSDPSVKVSPHWAPIRPTSRACRVSNVQRGALSRGNRSISWPVLVLWPMKRLNFRISQARSV